MKRKRRTRTKKPVQERRKTRPRRARQQPRLSPSNRALIAIIMLLYMLHLIDEKTLKTFTRSLYPKRKTARRRRRRKPSK